jgi:membrane protease YdiL (CAAX protease family)
VGAGQAASISQMMPHGWVERALWVLLAASAGISEEFVFRGYLQRQLTAFTGRTTMGLLLQVSIFAVAHGYQGVRSCLVIAIYGALFTLLALWRKSLRPGMIAHAWTDIIGGLVG